MSSSVKTQVMTKAIVQSAIHRFVTQGIKTQDGLKALLAGLGITAGTQRICRNEDHSAPFDFLWRVVTQQLSDFIVWANRSGSKSYLAGFLSWYFSGRLNRLETCILGGSMSQSEKSYKAMQDFWHESRLQDVLLDKEPTIGKTEWKNGSVVSILTASQKSVRGPHPQFLVLDEVDEMDVNLFETALSQPQSRYGISPMVGLYSTNHNIGGTMDMALELPGFEKIKWCVWECLESCKDYHCATCKLSPYCPGKQMKRADGYYKIADFIKKMQTLSEDGLMREWFCEKVGKGDLVYQHEFDERIHVVRVPFNPNKECYLSLDWGGIHPFSCGVWQFNDDYGWVRVDEVFMGQTTNKLFMKTCKLRPWWKNVWGAIADPARADLIKEWQEEGISVIGADNPILEGIESVKAALKPALGNPKIYINHTCVDFLREIKSYRTDKSKADKGKPIDKDNHTMDETRYFVRWKVAQIKQEKPRQPRFTHRTPALARR